MERNFGAEIDSIKGEIAEIKAMILQAFAGGPEASRPENPDAKVRQIRNMHPDRRLSEKMEELCTATEERDASGMITYMGVFSSGGRQSNWIKNEVNTDGLLALIENNTAEKVLNCLGNADRLNILLAVLKKPMTVAEIVSACGLNSTGQAYHHMKPLLAADLIAEDQKHGGKGVYVVTQHKVQGIIMLLAGICDMVDETYTRGAWEES